MWFEGFGVLFEELLIRGWEFGGWVFRVCFEELLIWG